MPDVWNWAIFRKQNCKLVKSCEKVGIRLNSLYGTLWMIIIIIDVAAKWLSRQAAAETAVPGSNAALQTMFTLCINNRTFY